MSVVFNNRWVVLLLAIIAQTSASFATQAIPTLGPFFQREFHLTYALVGTMVVLINIGSVFTLALAGKSVDRFGEKLVIGVGGTLVGLTLMGMLIVKSFYSALPFLLMLGFWYASATPGGSKAIMKWFSDRQRAMAMGIRQTGIPFGGLLAAVILPPFAATYGWRTTLFIAGLGVILCTLIFCFFYRETNEQIERGYEISNALPFLHFLSNRNFICIVAISIMLAISQSVLVSYLILFSMEVLQLSIAAGSYLLAGAQLAGGLGRIAWGVFSDKFFRGSRRIVLVIITQVCTFTTFMIALLNQHSPFWLISMIVILMGFSSIGWNGMFITYVSELGGYGSAASAVGLALTLTQIGYICGPPLFGLLIDLTESYRSGWFALSGLLCISLVLFKFLQEPLPIKVLK